MIPALSVAALASGIDQLEVGGLTGTPTTDDATAIWWNPAGLAAGHGTRVLVEVSPITAAVAYDRVDPYGFDGKSVYTTTGVLPFAGVATDLGVRGLGLGLGLAVPYANKATSLEDDPPGSYALISGTNEHVHLMAGAAASIADRFAAGATLSVVRASWGADLNTELVTQLDEQIADLGQESGYTDALIEDPAYGARLTYTDDGASAVTAAFGLQARPVDAVTVGGAFHLGYRVKHTGDFTIDFDCPPQSDVVGRFGAEAYGLCWTTLEADGAIGYRMPSRASLGVAVRPIEPLRLEVMGGWVGWKAFSDYSIRVSGVAERNDLPNPDTAALVEQDRLWARGAHDALWVGLDGRYTVLQPLEIGARVGFDQAAIPDEALSPNNWDAPTWKIGGRVAWRPAPVIGIAGSVLHWIPGARDITTSAFGVTLDDAAAKDDRWFYPQMNGLYRATITRFGLSVDLRLAHPPSQDVG